MKSKEGYREAAIHVLGGFQLIEESLKQYIRNYYDTVRCLLDNRLFFDYTGLDINEAALQRLLSIFSKIKICTQYQLSDGTVTDQVPYELINENITPVYHEVKGWHCSVKGLVERELPVELQDYIEFLEKRLEVPISLISTGPDRTETIHRFRQPA